METLFADDIFIDWLKKAEDPCLPLSPRGNDESFLVNIDNNIDSNTSTSSIHSPWSPYSFDDISENELSVKGIDKNQEDSDSSNTMNNNNNNELTDDSESTRTASNLDNKQKYKKNYRKHKNPVYLVEENDHMEPPTKRHKNRNKPTIIYNCKSKTDHLSINKLNEWKNASNRTKILKKHLLPKDKFASYNNNNNNNNNNNMNNSLSNEAKRKRQESKQTAKKYRDSLKEYKIKLEEEWIDSQIKIKQLSKENIQQRERLIQGFGAVVMGMDDEAFEEPLKEYKKKKGYASDVDMTADDWKALSVEFKQIFKKETGKDFPQDPIEQLRMSIGAVFGSWNSKRAFAYRNATGISHTLGTACNIQTMVFGNMGDNSATGVAFTRNPSTGENKFYGEYLKNAQGEDVVAGIRNCTDVNEMGKEFPVAYKELLAVGDKLESVFKNMQDVEFTIENEKLFMLQTRDGKRTARSQVRIALDMVEEKLIDKETAVSRLSPDDVNILLLPQLDPEGLSQAKKEGRQIGKGVNASPGGAVGSIVFDAATAEAWKNEKKDVILVRPFTKPEDVPGFFASKGILTAEGGATSHAAVVARQFGVPCVCGASSLDIDLDAKVVRVKQEDGSILTFKEGDTLSLNATTGEVYSGSIATIEADFDKEKGLQTILSWADEICKREYKRGTDDNQKMKGLQVWANADYGKDATRARKFGAQGIGLCRTEHMFFGDDRLPIVQSMILANSKEERQKSLDKLLVFQRKDFEDIFRAMTGLPVIIRLLDPPLHEFLPDYTTLHEQVAALKARIDMGANGPHKEELKEKEEMLSNVERFHESNPMMGLRGVRLEIVIPELLEMQVRAIAEAACIVQKDGLQPIPEIMIPLTSTSRELAVVKPRCEEVIKKVLEEQKIDIKYKFGTMIETPRAALTAGSIAEFAEFFSYGTNDLTQMSFGISRDDAEREFLLQYVTDRILVANPFQSLDKIVARLVGIAAKEGRATRPGMSLGICGEHGGDASSIDKVHKIGLNYVSCSPFRVPAARLAAAHAALNN